MKKNKYNELAYLNVLRMVAALCLAIFLHMPMMGENLKLLQFNENPVWNFLRNDSGCFVEMFFLISGMMFCLVGYKLIVKQQITYKKYLLKRLIRLYPAMIIAGLYRFSIVFTQSCIVGKPQINFGSLICTILFGSGKLFVEHPIYSYNAIAWYIGILMLCYVVGLLLTYASSKTKNKTPFCIPIILGSAIIISECRLPFLNLSCSRGYVFFFLGFYLMLFLEKFKNFKNRTILRIIILVYLVIIGFVLLSGKINLNPLPTYVIGLLVFPALLTALYDVKILNTFCSFKAIKILGGMSYFVYMFNGCIMQTWATIDNKCLFANSLGFWYLLFTLFLHLVIGFILYILFKNIEDFLLERLLISSKQNA